MKSFLKRILPLVMVVSNLISAPAKWVDFPNEDLSKYAKGLSEPFENLYLLSQSYHAIDKLSLDLLEKRILALNLICEFLNENPFEECDFEFVKQLQEIVNNKKWYLEELKKIYSQEAPKGILPQGTEKDSFPSDPIPKITQKLSDEPRQLLNNFEQPITISDDYVKINPINKRHFDASLGIFWGEYWLEALDPCHRDLTSYFDLWRDLYRDLSNPPLFFLWLETQNVSPKTPYLHYLPQELYKVDVLEGRLFWNSFLISKITQKLTARSHQSSGIEMTEEGISSLPPPFATTQSQELSLPSFGRLSKDFTYALDSDEDFLFIIDTEMNLLCAIPSQHIRHPSLSHSKEVLGSGILKVKNGQILALSFESGHYLPSIRLGKQIIDILKKKGVQFPDSLEITYFTSHGPVKTNFKNFLDLVTPNENQND